MSCVRSVVMTRFGKGALVALALLAGASASAQRGGPLAPQATPGPPADFRVDKIDPLAAGMSPERLARIAPRVKEFVDAGKTAGVVTLIARHGHVASIDVVGFQDLEKKT